MRQVIFCYIFQDWLEMQPNYSFHQGLLRNRPYAFLHDKEVQLASFITTVEMNVHNHNVHLHLTRAQTNKTTHKQTQWHMHTPTYSSRHM